MALLKNNDEYVVCNEKIELKRAGDKLVLTLHGVYGVSVSEELTLDEVKELARRLILVAGLET